MYEGTARDTAPRQDEDKFLSTRFGLRLHSSRVPAYLVLLSHVADAYEAEASATLYFHQQQADKIEMC